MQPIKKGATQTDVDKIPQWERDGFSSSPKKFSAIEQNPGYLYRAFSKTPGTIIGQIGKGSDAFEEGSKMEGSFFFVPNESRFLNPNQEVIVPTNIKDINREFKWDWNKWYLESQLNAWVFGNDFDCVACFKLTPNTPYSIGPIGFNTRAATEDKIYFPSAEPKKTGTHTIHQHDSPPPSKQDFLQVIVNLGSYEGRESEEKVDKKTEVFKIKFNNKLTLIETWDLNSATTDNKHVWVKPKNSIIC